MASSDYVKYSVKNVGDVILQHPTLTVTQTTVVSEDTRFTVLVRIVYTVRALIAEEPSFSLDAKITYLRKVLNISRGTFTASYGGNGSFLQASAATDVTGGPHPTRLAIQKVYGNRTAAVTWQIATEKQVVDDNVSQVGAWLDFIYTISTDLDQNFYQTRTISGFVKFSACHDDTRGLSADAFRWSVENSIAPVPSKPGQGLWQRTKRQYRMAKDKKTLAFNIVDKQLYTILPPGVTAGDMHITTIMRPYGRGRYVMKGWFEGTPMTARQTISNTIQEIWALFYNFVIKALYVHSGHTITTKNIERSTTAEWRKSRISFSAVYEMHGLPYLEVPLNISYFTIMATNWLASVTRKYSAGQFRTDLGPYGGTTVKGTTGEEQFGPVLFMDPMDKMPEGWAYPPESGARGPGEGGANAGSSAHIIYTSWHNHYTYKLDVGRTFIPILSYGADDIVQQTKNPRLYLIVTGEAESSGTEPETAPYPYTRDSNRLLLVSDEITPEAPSAADEYRITWKRVYMHKNPNFVEYRWPYTPLNTAAGGKLLGNG